MTQRTKMMARYFEHAPLQRFRVRPTVFMPTLPPLFDLHHARPAARRAVRRVAGGFTGLGVLELVPEDGGLRPDLAGRRAPESA